jgi:hypothetical protein
MNINGPRALRPLHLTLTWFCAWTRTPTTSQTEPLKDLRGAALGLPLALLKSSALRDWETRVAGKGDVPCGARAADVGGAPPCLVELRMPAGSAEPWLRTQLQPRSIRRPVRHKTQDMPLCWPRPSRASWPRTCRPSHNSGPHQWRSPAYRLRKLRGGSFSNVPAFLLPRLAEMATEVPNTHLGRRIYYERVHCLIVLAYIARRTDPASFHLTELPTNAERDLGAALGQAFHQGCSLADIALATGLPPDRVVAIGRRTIRRT